jgi:phosphoribosyl 1,2-cyclic phosphodiesterase
MMMIRCHGARGSIPVSGEEYVKYGGDSTCFEIRSKNSKIIIVDAGTGIRRLGDKLLSEEIFDYNIIFTHSHFDHILGFPFFRPIYNEKTTMSILGCPTTQGNIEKLLSKSMSAPLFPIRFEELSAKITYSLECKFSFRVDSVEVFPINLSHPNLGLGYSFVEDGKKFVFLTDNELGYRHRNGKTFEDYAEFSENADLLIHDAQFTPEEYGNRKTWGHSTYMDALNLALTAQVRRLGLFHHDPNRNDTDLDSIVRKCRGIIQNKGSDMECFALTQNTQLIL